MNQSLHQQKSNISPMEIQVIARPKDMELDDYLAMLYNLNAAADKNEKKYMPEPKYRVRYYEYTVENAA